MAIIKKNSFKVSRFDSEFSPRSRNTMSSDDDQFQKQNEVVESYDEFDDHDSGAGSDDFDLLELGETGEEFCQVGDQTCRIPFELYELTGFGDVLSMDVWNDILTEEERFSLTKYLPDVDQETYMWILKELFTGCNFHFGSPIDKLFDMLKGGLCEPRVALYRQGFNFFQKRQHYHLLRNHHNSMVTNLYHIRDAFLSCRGYNIEEKLRVLSIMKSQKSLMYENMEELGSDSSKREKLEDGLWSKRPKGLKFGQKMGRHLTPTLEFPYQGRGMVLESANLGKQNPKGILKLVGSKMPTTKYHSENHSLERKPGRYDSAYAVGYDSGSPVRMRDRTSGFDDAQETMHEVAVRRDRNFSRVGATDKAGSFKVGKKHEGPRGKEQIDSLMGMPMSLKNNLDAYGRNRPVNQLSDIKMLTAKPSNARMANNYGKKVNYLEGIQQFSVEEQMTFGKGRTPSLPLKGSRIELSDGAETSWHNKAQGEPFPVELSSKYGDWNVKSKKWMIGRESPDLKTNDRLFHSEYRTKPSQEKVRAISMQNGGRGLRTVKGVRPFAKGEETESDSSEQIDEDEDDNPLSRNNWAYPSDMKCGPVSKKAKFVTEDRKDSARTRHGSSHSSKKMGDAGDMAEVENYFLKAKQKGKMMHDISYLNNSTPQGSEDIYFSELGRFSGDGDRKRNYKLGKNGQLHGKHGERFHIPSLKAYPAERRQKGDNSRDYFLPQPNYLHDYMIDEDGNSLRTRQLAVDNGVTGRLGKKSQIFEAYADDHHERSDVRFLGCNSKTKKRKLKKDVKYMDEQDDDFLHSNPLQQLDDMTSSKKGGKRKLEDESGTLQNGASEPPVAEMAVEDAEPDTKPQKKPFTLITPTVHTGFSFSVIHLLSAVRIAMITLLSEDSLEGKHLDENDRKQKFMEEQDRMEEGSNGVHLRENLDVNSSEHSGQANLPSLTVQEMVNRVRSNPGDPYILEIQEPLQDLVRGVLKIFSSKTAPLGAKGWKPLAVYEKSTKCWSWIGPISHSTSDNEAVEEVTSPEAWGLPHKMLVKLVDSFANWLKSGQETLQQIGSLPAPPLTLMQFNLDEKERFRDLRAQKSLSTISESSEEVRAYFRKEEVLRYSIPDRAFSYTTIDGKKSIVAPLRRCGGKPTSKARDHFMLKRDRPAHVTILCLVRDAAARLPGSIGTRADVCTLIRDSQHIVEDVSDAQVNQVVSGALDRLHYERDPCVQFDGERKLWVYLHREREEEDFEDDGTSSTKKWKRQKKEAAEPFDEETITVAYHGPSEQTGIDLSSDVNVGPSCTEDDKRMELVYYDSRHHMEDNEASHGSEQGTMHHGPPRVWDALSSTPMQENKLLCHENSTNEDFDDETFSREPAAELLSTSLL